METRKKIFAQHFELTKNIRHFLLWVASRAGKVFVR